ncbi:PQQ-dependent dehydrogenase, methanol/ethanol family [Candidatus Poribacteria bacterium]|nr:PQQ-dependent dehydrogenase, methanol/ethanol family [Candidatus Poribacteria bacterium]
MRIQKGLLNSVLNNLLVVVLLLSTVSADAQETKTTTPQVPLVTEQMLLEAQDDVNNWLMYGRDYRSWRYSPLEQINTQNVKKLVPKWAFQTGVPYDKFECTPLVVNGVMYITTPNSHIFAVDARTGEEIWRYDYPLPDDMAICCGMVNRGAAIKDDKVFWVTLDAHLLALDAKTGTVLWDRVVGDHTNAESLTVAPLVVKDKVIVGMSGAEYGIRGSIDAFYADTGEQAWRFYTVPTKDEPGGDTWEGDSWLTGGGSAWVTGSYDPELNLVYWGTGNPAPDWNGDVRKGDNLYTDCIVALDADTGKLAWYFQATPHDVWDWDGVSEPVLIDMDVDGKPVKALVQVNRNGYFYVLDRTNGKFLYAKTYCEVTWSEGLDENGRPIVKPEAWTSEEGTIRVCPGVEGGKNWPPSAYNPQTNMLYFSVLEYCGSYHQDRVFYRKGLPYVGGGMTAEFDGGDRKMSGHISAIDISTGDIKWRHKTKFPNWAGCLTTAGGLVFSGDLEGKFMALDAKTGEVVWDFQTGSGVHAPPITYTVDGVQYIAIASGAVKYEEVNVRNGDTLYVFALFDEGK